MHSKEQDTIILTADECVAISVRLIEIYAAAWNAMGPDEEWPAKLSRDADDRDDETIVKAFTATLTGLTPEKRATAVNRIVKRRNYTELRAILVYSAIELAKHEPYVAINVLAPTRQMPQGTYHSPPAWAVGWDRFTAEVLFHNPNAAQRGVEALAAAGYEFEYRHDEIDDCGPTVFGTITGTTELDSSGLFAWLAGIVYTFSGTITEWSRDECSKQATLGSDAFGRGQQITDNPYPADTLAHQNWCEGFHAAEREKKSALRWSSKS
jgi:hypothetical protein